MADPLDLLANELAVHREKDLPRIAILRRFVEEEAALAFREETAPRERLGPARQLLEALGEAKLPIALFDRLLPDARLESDFRFLAHRAPDPTCFSRVLERVTRRGNAELVTTLESLRSGIAER